MITGMIHYFYPDLRKDEIRKFSLLALALFFIIGTYWLLRLLKDVVVFKIAFPVELWGLDYGRQMIPYLKTASPIVVFVAVAVYTKLVDMFEKHKLFYIFASFYATIFGLASIILFMQKELGSAAIGKWPLAILGCTIYLATESFGSLVVALFWSFTASSSKTDEAKRGFPLIVAAAQVGAVCGSALLLVKIPVSTLYSLAFVFMFGIMYTIYYLIKTTPKEHMVSDKVEKKSKPDFFAGIRLLLTRPYLMGILVVSTFYEIAKTVVDYQMKSQASLIYDEVGFQWFQGIYGIASNGLGFFIAILGLEYVMKRFGLRVCLLIYPVLFSISLIALYAFYVTGPTPFALLWATFAAMCVVAATSYAVNNPTKEMMYIPTSKDAKFKAKGIVDMLGGRAAKMGGSTITSSLNVPHNPVASIANLMAYGTLISLGVIGLWIIAAIYVGNKNAELTKNNQIIE